MADIFDEVNEDLRAERLRQFALRYGWVVGVLVLLLIAGVGGWQYWRWQSVRQSDAVAAAYIGAMRAADGPDAGPTPARTAAAATFDRLAATGPEGYRSLALLRGAALHARAGDGPAALAAWDKLSADTSADPLLRDLASLLWVQHEVDAGDPAAVEGRLQPLLAPGNPWRALARESQAWLALRTGKVDEARDTLRQLSADAAAPDGVRGRANGLLVQLGEATPPPAGAGTSSTGTSSTGGTGG